MDTDKIDSISDTPTKKRDHPTSSPEDNVTTNIAKLREAVDKENATKKFKRNENEIETNKSLKNKTIKIIVSNHNIKPENITKNHINEYCIKNFSVIDAKQSYVNKELLMCTILTCDINKSINKLNWKVGEQNLKITVDKKSNLLISLCVNKIFDQEGQELSLSITRIELTEEKIHKEEIENITKKLNKKIDSTQLASILYETSYAIVTNKMCEPMSIASNIIQIIQRSVGNIEKEVLFNNLGKLAESSLIFSPPENTNDLSFLKNDN